MPPTAPVAPVSPKRPALLAAIWVPRMGIAAGVAYLMTLFRPIVSSVRTINELTEYPVLGVVGVAFPDAPATRVHPQYVRFSAATAGLMVAFAAARY